MIKWLTLAQASAKVGRSGTWLRSLCTREELVSRHDAGILEISAESLALYIQSVKDAERQRKARLKAELDGDHERPSTRACNMIRRKVRKDPRLTDQERTFLVSKINQYQYEWDLTYRSRKVTSNGS